MKHVNCPYYCCRQVYSSLSFVIPVIFFTLVYNIPKFFELSTEAKKLETNNNTDLNTCLRDVVYRTNSFFEVSEHEEKLIKNSPPHPALGVFVSKPYFSAEEVFLITEDLSKHILQNCCDCTDKVFLKATDGLQCSLEEITSFISRLTTHLSNFNGKKKPNIPEWVVNVR